MRILFTANPLIGHVFPLLPLMYAARNAGHEVMVATGAELIPELQGRGFDTWTVGPSFGEAAAELQQSTADPTAAPGMGLARDAIFLFARPAVRRALELIPRAAVWGPDIVISEVAEFAGREAALATGALPVTHGFGTHIPESQEFAGAILDHLSAELGTPSRRHAFGTGVYLDPCPPSLQAGWLSGMDTWLIRPGTGEIPAGRELPQAILELPDRPVVYLTLGTVFNDPDLARTVLDAIEDLPVSIVVTTGPGADPSLLGPRPSNVAVVQFVPQALVLPYASAVVSHTGSGTMLGALAAGVPQVCLPRGADQFANAERVLSVGAGVRLLPEELSAEGLRAAVQAVLHDQTYAQAAKALQVEIGTMPPAAEVLADLVALVDDQPLTA
ncbi:MAG: glycosyltransferase [Microlunatus sp.]